ncbi:type IVB pilus formation R64 PilN family outer membrane protein [Roseateles asaccharophilus]|uniref:type II secretion system protein GspD n=1 Tax=Roseateles asaccharophilus TaxID=582607 RepID=UPI00383544B8
MNKLIKIALAVAVGAAFSGCAVVDHTVAKYEGQQQAAKIDKQFDAAIQPASSPRIQDNEGIWVNKRSVSIKEEQLPAVFRSALNIGFEVKSSLRDVANMVSRETGLRFSFAPDVLKEADLQMLNAGFRSEGDLRQVLNQLTAQQNMSWKYRGGSVEIYRFDTQVFQIAVLPGSTEMSAQVGNRNSSGGTAGGSTGGTSSGGTSSGSAGQDVRYSAKLEFWKGLQNDIKNLMSRDGKDGSFTVSESTQSITVTGTPTTLAAVESYVRDINSTRTRQVALEIRAYTVDNASGREFGMKWDLAFTKMAKDLGLSSTIPGTSNTAAGTLTAILGKSSTSPFAGTQLMLNALSTLGNTNVAVESSQMVLSGEAVPVNSMREVNYLSEVSTNSVPNAGTQTSLKQSTVTEGFALTVLPIVIGGNEILLKGVMDVSSIDRIEEATSGGQTIRTPQRSSRSLPMSVHLRSGETYIYGLREALASFSDSGNTGTALINTLTGGQHSSKESRKTIFVTVTPRIVNPIR